MGNLNNLSSNDLIMLKTCFSLDFLGIHRNEVYQKLENLLQSIPKSKVHEIMTESLGPLPEWFISDPKPHCCPIHVLFFIVNRKSNSITIGDRLREFDFLLCKIVDYMSTQTTLVPLGLNEFSLLFLRHEELRVQYLLKYINNSIITTVWTDKLHLLYNCIFSAYIEDDNFPVLFTQMFYNGFNLDTDSFSKLCEYHPQLLTFVSQPCVSRFHFTDSTGVERDLSRRGSTNLSSFFFQCHETKTTRDYDLMQVLPSRPKTDTSLDGIIFSPQYSKPSFELDLINYPYYQLESQILTKLNIHHLFKPILNCFGQMCTAILENLTPDELDHLSVLIPELFPLLAVELSTHQYHCAYNLSYFYMRQVDTLLLNIAVPIFQSQPSPKFILGLDLFIADNFLRLDVKFHLYDIYSRKPFAYILHNLSTEGFLVEYDVLMNYIRELMRLTPIIDTYVLMKCVLLIQKHTIANKNRLCAAIYDDLYSIVEKHQEKIYDSAAFLFLLNHTPSAMSLYTPENLSRWESVYLDVFVNRKKPNIYSPTDFYTRLLIECALHQQVEVFDLLVDGYLSRDPLYQSFQPDSKTLTVLFSLIHTSLSLNSHYRSSYSNQLTRINSISERYIYEMFDIRDYISQAEYLDNDSGKPHYYTVSRKYNETGLDLLVRIIDFTEKSNIPLIYLTEFYYEPMFQTYFSDYLELPPYYPSWTPQSSVVEMLSVSFFTKRREKFNESTIYLDLLLKVGDRPNEKNRLSMESLKTSFTQKFCVGHIGLLSLWKKHYNTVLCFQKVETDANTSTTSYQTILHLLMLDKIRDNRIPDECSFSRLLDTLLSLFDDIQTIEMIDV